MRGVYVDARYKLLHRYKGLLLLLELCRPLPSFCPDDFFPSFIGMKLIYKVSKFRVHSIVILYIYVVQNHHPIKFS